MPDVITLDEAKAHLRITTAQEDSDVQDKLDAATQIVIDYLTRRDTDWNTTMDAWTSSTVPKSVRAAILIQLGELYTRRGDDPTIDQSPTPTSLSRTVMSLLMRYRDPGLA
jgi:hypothetical protein